MSSFDEGDTVRRAPGPNAAYVRNLLMHLQRYNWPGAPRLLGVDEQGFDVFLRYPGSAASSPYQPPAVWSDASLARVARLLRQLHDLTVGTVWAGDAEVACHNDITPANTVYRESDSGLRPCGFVNWDFAGPGRRVHDLAYACWRFLDLGPARSEPAGPARLMRLMCDSYELGRKDRAGLVDALLWWQQRILAEERQRLGLTVLDERDQPHTSSAAGSGAADDERAGADTAECHAVESAAVPTSNAPPAEGMPGTELPSTTNPADAAATGRPDAVPLLSPDDGLTESIADIQAALDWVRKYGDILDAVVTARNPPPAPDPSSTPPGTPADSSAYPPPIATPLDPFE